MIGRMHTRTNRKNQLVKALVALTIASGAVLAGAGTAGASSSRAAYNPYKEIAPAATCETYFNANWQPVHRMVSVVTPTMYATTGGTYRVSWQPFLYKWNSSTRKWALDQAGPVLVGIASLGTALPSFDGFPTVAGNYYRVAVAFRWYRNGHAFRHPCPAGWRATAKSVTSTTRTAGSISGRRKSATPGAT